MANPSFNRLVLFTVVGILLFMPANNVDGFSNGVNKIGNEGCLCHGDSNPSTEIILSGLPEKFASNTQNGFGSIDVGILQKRSIALDTELASDQSVGRFEYAAG